MSDDAVEQPEGEAHRTAQSNVWRAGERLVRQETVVLLVDLVESVRLMQEHEDSIIRRWTDFIQTVITELLPR